MKTLNVAIVGAGLIGGKRAAAIKESGLGKLKIVADPDFEKAANLAVTYQCEAVSDWKKAVIRKDVEAIIIAVPNKFIMPIALLALKNGKHILSEKPLGRNSKEATAILEAAKTKKRLVKVGFNHRFHGGLLKAKELADQGKIGKIFLMRARYGHGGRLGMEKEWRASKDICGGGELLDQGVHIIDLMRWFGGEFKEVLGVVETKFWPMAVEDNAFVILRNQKVSASFHVSWTNWKNIFSLEIFGDKGFLAINGLGGSYGEEILTWGVRPKKFGKPEIKEFKFGADESWLKEWGNFYGALRHKNKILGDGEDGLKANEIIEAIYRSSMRKRPVRLR